MANGNSHGNTNQDPPRPTDQQLLDVSKRIDEALATCSVDHIKSMPAMQQAIHLAKGVETLRKALTRPVMEELFMPLQNTTLGFLTDKPEVGYNGGIVRDCVIEALIRGFQVVGNEFNIISGRAYFTREGFERRVREFPNLTNLRHHPMLHVMSGDKTALVPYRINYKLDGKDMVFEKIEDERIQVRVNAGMGPDAIIGKARRKALAALFDLLNGTNLSASDGDVGDAVIVTSADPAPSKQQYAMDDLLKKQAESKQGQQTIPGTKPADDYPEPGSKG